MKVNTAIKNVPPTNSKVNNFTICSNVMISPPL
jgi:hypothetical protein